MGEAFCFPLLLKDLVLYFFEFKSKLHKVNPELWIDAKNAVEIGGTPFKAAPIYSRANARKGFKGHKGVATGAVAKLIEVSESGHLGVSVAAVDVDWVPEHDVFNLDRGNHLKKGYRTILMTLFHKGLVDLSKARKHFGCAELGLNDYDLAGYEKKLVQARKGTAWEKK